MTFGFVCYIIPFVAHWDIAKLVRHRILIPTFRRFESCYPSHVGTSFACSDFFYYIKKSVTRSAVPPFPKKVTLGSPIRLQARSFTAHSHYQLFSGCSTSAIINLFGFFVFGQALLVPIFLFHKKISHPLRCPSSSEKSHARLAYSLASALIYGSQSLPTFFGVFYISNHKFVWFLCFRTSFACSDFLFQKISRTILSPS